MKQAATSFCVHYRPTRSTLWLSLLVAWQLSGCSLAPAYEQPVVDTPVAFATDTVWQPLDRIQPDQQQAWWRVFNDPLLDQLNQQVLVDNQNLAASAAQYRIALANIRAAEAGLLPNFGSNAGMTRSGNGLSGALADTSTSYSLGVNASWEVDLWGRLRDQVSSNEARAQASLADLNAARLSMQALLTQNYLQLRNLDQQQQLIIQSINAYQRFLTLTDVRHRAGVASKLDVTQAETQLYGAQAQLSNLQEQRQKLHNAIATLVGKTANGVQIPAEQDYTFTLPPTPELLPSTLLTQRPDIIASERRVYAANQQIGIAKSAYFPILNLGASANLRNNDLSKLLDLPTAVWSLGPSLALTLFDGGLRAANEQIAIATMEQAAANYRQTVLSAFEEVENNLSSLYWLSQEATLQRQTLSAAQQALYIAEKQYEAGINSALNVINAQTSELNAKRSLANIEHNQRIAALNLWRNTGAWDNELEVGD